MEDFERVRSKVDEEDDCDEWVGVDGTILNNIDSNYYFIENRVHRER
jgi:hypothetical protein